MLTRYSIRYKIVSMMELDFEMAVSIKEEIIKHAVHWFTGDASVDGLGEDEEGDEGVEVLSALRAAVVPN